MNPPTISSKEWMNTHHFIKGINEHPPFCQRNEWTSSILSKEWMNIQHFIKTLSSLTKGKSMHTISLYSKDTSRQTEIYISCQCKINGPQNLRPWFGTYCSTKGGNGLDSSNILKQTNAFFFYQVIHEPTEVH